MRIRKRGHESPQQSRKSAPEIPHESHEGEACPLRPTTPRDMWKRMVELAREINERDQADDEYDIEHLEVTADLGRELAELTAELSGPAVDILEGKVWVADYTPLPEPPPLPVLPPKPFPPVPTLPIEIARFATEVGKPCRVHGTFPEPDEPCWGCENDANQ